MLTPRELTLVAMAATEVMPDTIMAITYITADAFGLSIKEDEEILMSAAEVAAYAIRALVVGGEVPN